MKCPLFILSDRRVQMGEETEIGDCIREACRWGCAAELYCALPLMASAHKRIADRLGPPEMENEPEP